MLVPLHIFQEYLRSIGWRSAGITKNGLTWSYRGEGYRLEMWKHPDGSLHVNQFSPSGQLIGEGFVTFKYKECGLSIDSLVFNGINI